LQPALGLMYITWLQGGQGMPRPSVEFTDVECVKETDLALLCVIDGVEHWVPKSQVLEDSEVNEEGDEGTLVITEWFALQEGIL
jgi:hypothetical protein